MNWKVILFTPLLLLTGSFIEARAQSDWLQWGGPNRNFTSSSKGLAATWPATGPRRLWSRPLGAGHSSIIASGNTLYTMYSEGGQESVIALAADTGKTIWEHKYASSDAGLDLRYGAGPHSTPLLVGDLLFTVGSRGQLFAFDKKTGKVAWSHDLWTEYGGTKMGRGYSCSPVAYKNTVILTLGGPGQTLVAFNQKDGTVAWKNQTLDMSPSSPLIVNVDGQDQLIAFLGKVVAGLDPNNGNLIWTHPHVTEWGLNISTPVWGAGNLLFVAAAYGMGGRVLHLSRAGGGGDRVDLGPDRLHRGQRPPDHHPGRSRHHRQQQEAEVEQKPLPVVERATLRRRPGDLLGRRRRVAFAQQRTDRRFDQRIADVLRLVPCDHAHREGG